MRVLQLSPRIYEGETTYSIVARMIFNDLSTSVSEGMQNVLGSRNLQLDAALPSYIDKLSGLTGIDSANLVLHHSIFPYLSAFANPQAKSGAENSMLAGSSSAAYKALGLLANRLPESPELKFCPTCADEQNFAFGEAYWLREHQLPLVTTCLKHGYKLVTKKRQRKHVLFPDVGLSAETSNCPVAAKVAELSQWLLNDNLLDAEKLRGCYAVRLMQRGLATAKSINVKKWREALNVYYQPLMSDPLMKTVFKTTSDHGFPANVFYLEKANHHPIKHVLIICHLFEHFGDFVVTYTNAMKTYQEMAAKTSAQPLPQASIDKERHDNVIVALKSKQSLRQIMTSSKVGAATIRNIARKSGIGLQSRKRKVNTIMFRAVTIKLMIGEPVAAIAAHFELSVSDVEQVLTGQPEIKVLRQKVRCYAKRKKARKALLHAKRNTTDLRVKDLKNKCYADYMWLYKHDRDWFNEQMTKNDI
jgi:hypothetical protein